jgi:phosphatidylserine/phosphatidylglycerophosphate/cardiolipin synthase-like enzyme
MAAAVSHEAIVYFSPEDQLEKRLIQMIEQEKKSIAVCVYSFTHLGIANALIDARKRGVDVEVVVDRFSVKGQSPLQKIVRAGIPVYVWDPQRPKKARRPLMHNKFCVFGGSQVWTGSFNFTYEAARIHQENAVVLQDDALASAYQNQFDSIKIRSCVPYAQYGQQKRR